MNKEEATIIARKFLNIEEHALVIVTGNGSVYTSEKIDPADEGEKVYVKGGPVEPGVTEDEPWEKKPSKKNK